MDPATDPASIAAGPPVVQAGLSGTVVAPAVAVIVDVISGWQPVDKRDKRIAVLKRGLAK